MERTLYKNKACAQGEVYEILLKQNGHPIHAQQIGDRLNLSGSQVSDIVLELRSMGFMICGDDAYDGYYMGTLDQVKKTIEAIRNRIKLEKLVVDLWENRTKDQKREDYSEAAAGEQIPGQQSMDL